MLLLKENDGRRLWRPVHFETSFFQYVSLGLNLTCISDAYITGLSISTTPTLNERNAPFYIPDSFYHRFNRNVATQTSENWLSRSALCFRKVWSVDQWTVCPWQQWINHSMTIKRTAPTVLFSILKLVILIVFIRIINFDIIIPNTDAKHHRMSCKVLPLLPLKNKQWNS